MPAAFRTRLRPPSHPTRYFARTWAVGEHDIDAGFILRDIRDFASAIDRYAEFTGPLGKDALDLVLPERQAMRIPRRKIADVEPDPGKARDLRHLPLRQEPVGDAALIEHLDGAGV